MKDQDGRPKQHDPTFLAVSVRENTSIHRLTMCFGFRSQQYNIWAMTHPPAPQLCGAHQGLERLRTRLSDKMRAFAPVSFPWMRTSLTPSSPSISPQETQLVPRHLADRLFGVSGLVIEPVPYPR